MLFQLLGGIGLFLMGMILLTDGLKSFAGAALRRALVKFTGSPLKAVGSGALLTAVVQSSSATTLTVIGFVSSGLLSFSQSIGVVMGASLGTTTTAWIVSVLGLKVSIGYYALPLVGVGAFLRLLATGRWKSFGWAVAGFGMIFIGISNLQEGMAGASSHLAALNLPETGFISHFLSMSIGIVMTILMQSSSAAVATTLTALHTGTVNFEQAASLMVGAAIGTTATGAIATIGSNIPAKRTAMAHVSFNLITGLLAISLLPVLLWLISLAQIHLNLEAGAVSLAAFHTGFIFLGIVLFYPFLGKFAAWVERVLPETELRALRHLDDSVLNMPSVAIEVTRRALSESAIESFRAFHRVCSSTTTLRESEVEQIKGTLASIQEFFVRIPADGGDTPPSPLRIAQVHAIEHLNRLLKHLPPSESRQSMFRHPRLKDGLAISHRVLHLGDTGLVVQAPENWVQQMAQAVGELAKLREAERSGILKGVAKGEIEMATTLQVLDTLRWLERVSFHVWRISYYLSIAEYTELDENGYQPYTLNGEPGL